MRRAERVVDVEVHALRQRPRASPGRSTSRRRGSACSPARECARRARARARRALDGRDRERGVVPFRPAEVRAHADLGRVALEQQLERRQRGTDPRVVGDAPVLERHVQIAANEDALPGDVRGLDGSRQPHYGSEPPDEIDQATRVAPLVVVPAEDLGRPAVRHRQLAVEDARVRVADDVRRDERILGVLENAREGARLRRRSRRRR